MIRESHRIDGGALADLVDAGRNAAVIAYLARFQPSCHSDPAAALISAAVARCGDWIVFSPSFTEYKYVALITNRTVFALGIGANSVCYRVPGQLHGTALTTGAVEASEIGRDWVRFELFRADWPAPDLLFWTLRSYAAVRNSSE